MAGRLGLTADLEFMPWTCVPDIRAAARIVEKVSSPAAGILVDALHFDRSAERFEDLRKIPCGAAALSATVRRARRAACDDRGTHPCRSRGAHVSGRGRPRSRRLTKEMPADITISIEVPTAALAKTADAETRARRALRGAKAVVAAASAAT